ncbi:MAG: endolytic transglycosylase MltG [Nitrosomonadales bacterium]|nr:MAG: endolytic transglycosylase MltG [Nitrosomonadales bacterium]
MIRVLLKFTLLVLMLAAMVAGWMYHFAHTPLTLPQSPYYFALKHGSSLRGVAQQMAQEGVLREPWSFIALVRGFGKDQEIKAGNYQLEAGLTPLQLFTMITSGDVAQSGVTFIEGWTFRQMREALDKQEGLRHLSMSWPDAQLMKALGAPETAPEGLFFPDTYYFSSDMSDLDILKRAYLTMQRKRDAAWQSRAAGLPYRDSYQALIMASIVEKETASGEERPLIARVFINRLRLNMRLQTDPTVIYGMGEMFDGNLRKRDLLTDTPYNTYTRNGLPPTPIAMPGLASMEAVLHPVQSDALYFVGRGDGHHVFSATLAEHNRAVSRYQLKAD